MWFYKYAHSKTLAKFIETLRQTHWHLSTGFTKFEALVLALTSLLLKLGQKRPKCVHLVQKMVEGLKWSQNETKLINQIKFVIERSKLGLYRLLERVFSWRQFLGVRLLLVKVIPNVPKVNWVFWSECLRGINT